MLTLPALPGHINPVRWSTPPIRRVIKNEIKREREEKKVPGARDGIQQEPQG